MNDTFKAYNNLYTPAERKELLAISLKTYREIFKQTQREVANAIGINQQTYASYERGRNEPPAEILVRLSFYYDVPLDVLMQRDNMTKDKLTAKKQIEIFEQGIQEMREKIYSNDEETTKKMQGMLDSLLQLGDIMKSLTGTDKKEDE